ncbi:unnamed protein product, partial [Polarella glacialis]
MDAAANQDDDQQAPARSAASNLVRAGGWVTVGVLVVLMSRAILKVDDMITLFWLGTLVNVALSIVKLGLAQVATHQKALMADAVHGLGDTVAEVVSALAYTEAARPPDKEHPWGHGKIESVGAVLVTCILLYIAASMGYDSITTLAPLCLASWRDDAGAAAPNEITGNVGKAPMKEE